MEYKTTEEGRGKQGKSTKLQGREGGNKGGVQNYRGKGGGNMGGVQNYRCAQKNLEYNKRLGYPNNCEYKILREIPDYQDNYSLTI